MGMWRVSGGGGKNFAPINARALRRVAEKCWPNEGTGMTGPTNRVAWFGRGETEEEGSKKRLEQTACVTHSSD